MLDSVRGQGVATGVAGVVSPIGPLDCVLLVEAVGDLEALEGAALQLDSSGQPYTAMCIDSRGLVVLSPGGSFMPMTAYLSMRPSAPQGLGLLPFPVKPYRS